MNLVMYVKPQIPWQENVGVLAKLLVFIFTYFANQLYIAKTRATVQLIFNFTHAHVAVQLLNYTINISTYTLITCEHSKEQ